MKKTLIAIAAAATLVLASVATPQPAQARHGRIAAGIIGLGIGTILGAAAANSAPYYYGPGPAYYAGPPCQWTRERIWDGWRWRWRNVQVCY